MIEPEPLLSATALSVAAGGRPLLDGLTLSVRQGECWGLIGPNGSGKTSLLHVLAGILPPAGGVVRYATRPAESLSSRQRARHVGIMLQNEDHVFPATVLERVLAGRHAHRHPWAWETATDIQLARDALARTGMLAFEDRLLSSLSGGERRRAQLAALLYQAPVVAMLDEPENDLDLRYQAQLLAELVGEFTRNGRGAIMVLHDVNLAVRLCSHLVMLDGKTAIAGTTDQIATSRRLSALYGCSVREVTGAGRRLFVTD